MPWRASRMNFVDEDLPGEHRVAARWPGRGSARRQSSSPRAPSMSATSQRNGTPSTSSALLERGVLGGGDPAQRAGQVAVGGMRPAPCPTPRAAIEARVVVQVPEVGDALEAQLGASSRLALRGRSPRTRTSTSARRRRGRARRAAGRSGPAPRRSGRAGRARRARASVRQARARANSPARLPRAGGDAVGSRRRAAGPRGRRTSMAHSASTWWARANVRPSPSPSSLSVSRTIRSATLALALGQAGPRRLDRDAAADLRAPSAAERSTARSMSAIASSTRPIGAWTPARSSSSSGSRSAVEPRRASRLSIGRGSTVSVTDSLRPFIISVARSWPPASSTRLDRLERPGPAASCRRPGSPATVGSIGAPRSAARVGELERAGDLAAQRDAGGDGVVDERRRRRAGRAWRGRCRAPGPAGRRPSAGADVELVQRGLARRRGPCGTRSRRRRTPGRARPGRARWR